MSGQARPAKGDGNNRWVLAIGEHGSVVVQGGANTLQGQVGDTILVAPDSELADVQVEIGEKLLSGEISGAVAARMEQVDARGNPLTAAEEILRVVAEQLGFKVPRLQARVDDPMHVVLMAARQRGATVRAKRADEDDWREFTGEEFLRWYKQLSQGFGEGQTILVDRVWVVDDAGEPG